MKLVDAVSEQYSLSKKKAKKIIDSRSVFVNHKRVWIASYTVRPSDVIEVADAVSYAEKVFKPVYEDKEYCIFLKPPAVLTVGKNSFEMLIQKQYTSSCRAVHRLDYDTSGLVIFVKNKKIFDLTVPVFRNHEMRKEYLALVQGQFPFSLKKVETPIEGKSAVTVFRVAVSNSSLSLLEAEIVTGRTHQIRRHLKELGFFLVGEKLYQKGSVRKEEFKKAGRHFLHAAKVEFENPVTHKLISVKSSLPDDFKQLMKRFHLSF